MGITREQALDCFRSDDLIGIGMEADAVRRRLHPEGVVTYGIEAAIGCVGRDVEAICVDIEDAETSGAAGIVLGGVQLRLEGMEALLVEVKRRFPGMSLQGLSAAEITAWGGDLDEAMTRLHAAGLEAIGGCEPEIPGEAWVRLQRAAHGAGMRTTARIVFGAGETIEARMDGLNRVRILQEETGGFAALAPISYHAAGGRELDETTAVEYLKTLAVTRMYGDNIENVQADWTTQGRKVLQMGLRFGANDVGSVGVGTSEEELRRVIRDAGFKPAQRDAGYRVMMLS